MALAEPSAESSLDALKTAPDDHPYLTGNFAPVSTVRPLTTCSYEGEIPEELAGGQYIRNGGNTIFNEDLGRDYHWFDGDGMLSGVLFKRSQTRPGTIVPQFVNQFVLTDLFLSGSSSPTLKHHIVPSIATLVNPATSFLRVCLAIMRTIFIVFLSHLPGSSHKIKRISVVNTGVFYHDKRALATCESGPPMRVQLPEMETVGWYHGDHAEGEKDGKSRLGAFGSSGPLAFMQEWTTGHPKVDPRTGELLLYHCSFKAPYIHYTISPADSFPNAAGSTTTTSRTRINRAPVPGVTGAKMTHDFGVSSRHTIMMDLPLTMDPTNIMKGKPVIDYDPHAPTRFGIFPRYAPSEIRWFETDPSCIFHTANAWDEVDAQGNTTSVHFLACRLTSPALLFITGNVAMPSKIVGHVKERAKLTRPPFFDKYDNDKALVQMKTGEVKIIEEIGKADLEAIESYDVPVEEQCRLHYYEFDMARKDQNIVKRHFALSNIPFEFPSVHPQIDMTEARYVYGCSTSTSSFNVALGRTVKIDTIVKMDVLNLIARGKESPHGANLDCVDTRTVHEIMRDGASNKQDLIKVFKLPQGYYAQEPRFVPRANAESEDDGFLLFFVFDESQILPNGRCRDDAASELWVLNAKTMIGTICRVRLPQRVPYGFHGMFFTEQQIAQQRAVSTFRTVKPRKAGVGTQLHDMALSLAS